MYRTYFRTLTVSVILLAGCASGVTRSGAPTGQSDILTREELSHLTVTSAYEAIQQERQRWFRSYRGRGSLTLGENPIWVYVDGVRRGEIEVLRNIMLENVARLAFVNPRDATTRWGTNHASGCIEVTLIHR
jgi:hypothetical protein